jgi:hypothetical protein
MTERNERERVRKLAARKGFKLRSIAPAESENRFTLTGKLGNARAFRDLAAVLAALKPVRVWNLFDACSVAEGFCGGEDASDAEKISAWQWLIDTNACASLQGWYGRTAASLIEQGLCKPAERRAAQAA